MNLPLHQSRILLTGASGGLGQALAVRLAEAGARLVLTARRQDALERLAAEVRKINGFEAEVIVADWNTLAGRQRLRQRLVDTSAPVDTLILNAAVNQFGSFEDSTDQELLQVLGANLVAPMRLVHESLPLLKTRNSRLVFVNSTFGRLGHPGFASYCAAKHGLKGFAEALSRELAGSSVRVMEFSPRAMRTPMNGAAVQAVNKLSGSTEDDPREVAEAMVRGLASGRARLQFGFPERIFMRLNALFPALLDRVLGRRWPALRQAARVAQQANVTLSSTPHHFSGAKPCPESTP